MILFPSKWEKSFRFLDTYFLRSVKGGQGDKALDRFLPYFIPPSLKCSSNFAKLLE